MKTLLALEAQQAAANKQPHHNFFTILLSRLGCTIEQMVAGSIPFLQVCSAGILPTIKRFREQYANTTPMVATWGCSLVAPCKRVVLILPLVFISLFITPATPAYAQSTVLTPRQVVEYALTLEKLEADFYRRGMYATEKGGLASAPQSAKDAIASFGKDDAKHVDNLSAVLKTLGGNPDAITIPANPNYNAILGRNPFAKPNDFLLAGQFLEDLGVAAYKGQVQNLLAAGFAAKPLLATALAIHSVEARHAAAIRFLRQTLLGDNVRPWIRNPNEVIYKENRDGSPIPLNSEAFDGYATRDEVLTLLAIVLSTTQQPGPVRALW